MADVGVKLSSQGNDIFADSQYELPINSKYPVYKVYASAADTIQVIAGNQGAIRFVTDTLNIPTVILVFTEFDIDVFSVGTALTKRMLVTGRTAFVPFPFSALFVYTGVEDGGDGLQTQLEPTVPLANTTTFKYFFYIMHDQLAF